MKSISHLPKNEQQHFDQCNTCGEYYDMRDLSDVLSHEHDTVILDPVISKVNKVSIPAMLFYKAVKQYAQTRGLFFFTVEDQQCAIRLYLAHAAINN